MEGWVGPVAWPIAGTLPTKWSHVRRSSGKVRQSKTDVLTTEPRRQLGNVKTASNRKRFRSIKWLIVVVVMCEAHCELTLTAFPANTIHYFNAKSNNDPITNSIFLDALQLQAIFTVPLLKRSSTVHKIYGTISFVATGLGFNPKTGSGLVTQCWWKSFGFGSFVLAMQAMRNHTSVPAEWVKKNSRFKTKVAYKSLLW